ncbi:type IV toxin-antitoxin system AbiEi family antitoxin domain-containing protein [Nocardioides coralli]|uniref:type IV toxin-antitoxin system AbiEi family antitoxin domain-containing protein n=1 Tax=Nocardioides coralli TaxID=2872154 RepID=UPI001CA41454|nr:type IV toxin-antitoxin system AbiEi family antitoxin domain-containing protein [Nocardioides coralli]QZY30667.1 type IV toxin-antitoxin system AbiEi family antitoxin domain-containing protein [Nocardioides coralli]
MSQRVSWLPPDLPFLDERCPLPLTRPFTRAQAEKLGVSRARLSTLLRRGLVRQVLRGVYVAAQAVDSIELRAEALAAVVPPFAVVTDRTAAWLHMVDVLPASAVHEMPPVEIYSRARSRVRRPSVTSGERRMRDEDVMVIGGVLVTTKLRTALDLGRRLNRYHALAALDALLRAGVRHEELLDGVRRFRGERGVVQLRTLAPLADRRAESPPESVLRLHWLETPGLPPPDPQLPVHDGGIVRCRIDVGNDDLRYGAEYNGRAFHEDVESDEARLGWLDEERGWLIDVFVDADIFPRGDPTPRLMQGASDARRRSGRWVPQGHYLPQ